MRHGALIAFFATIAGFLAGWGLHAPKPVELTLADGPVTHHPAVFYSGKDRCVDFPDGWVNCEDGRTYMLVTKP